MVRPLGGVLNGVAKKMLPVTGGALGTFFGGPVGATIGSKLGSLASSALEMEMEGLSPTDLEFEVARRFVRVAGTAARQAALAQPGRDAQTAAKNALITALRQHVPNFSAVSRGAAAQANAGSGQTGRWIRRGNKIILLGA